MPKTKGEIKTQLQKMYTLRKELRENIHNCQIALNDVNNIIDALTSQLDKMGKELENVKENE